MAKHVIVLRRELRENADQIKKWAQSAEGKAAIQKGARRAGDVSGRLRAALQPEPEMLQRPVSL